MSTGFFWVNQPFIWEMVGWAPITRCRLSFLLFSDNWFYVGLFDKDWQNKTSKQEWTSQLNQPLLLFVGNGRFFRKIPSSSRRVRILIKQIKIRPDILLVARLECLKLQSIKVEDPAEGKKNLMDIYFPQNWRQRRPLTKMMVWISRFFHFKKMVPLKRQHFQGFFILITWRFPWCFAAIPRYFTFVFSFATATERRLRGKLVIRVEAQLSL